MKLISIIISFLILTKEKPFYCQDKRKGIFQIERSNGKTTIVTRKAHFQTHEMREENNKWKFKIKWTSDCTYKLFDLKILKGTLTKEDFSMDKKTDTLYCRIIESAEGFFIVKSSLSNSSQDILMENKWKKVK